MLNIKNIQALRGRQSFQFSWTGVPKNLTTILGPSGAGKSTFLDLIAGFTPAHSGKILFKNQDITSKKPADRPVTTLFQQDNLFMHLSVYDNLALGLCPRGKLSSPQKTHLRSIATELGISECLLAYPSQLSGGQQQRVALTRCLARQSPILLLDEPLNGLDPENRIKLCQLIRKITTDYNLYTFFVTHQLDDIAPFTDTVAYIKAGKISASGPIQDFYTQKTT